MKHLNEWSNQGVDVEVLHVTTFKEKIFDYETNKEWNYTGERPVIIDFYADWCGPCRMQMPILEDMAEKYKGLVDVYKVDTEASPELAAIFEIRSIPSILFIPLKGEPAMNTGLIQEEGFEQAIADLFEIPAPQ
ncbi:MAG: thioredoxin domain-containing protein [Bdellovibrionaceae bacterium]|nr:thioredoxin domain-containing protein [Pseudobdellovibrionaceae bacterium]